MHLAHLEVVAGFPRLTRLAQGFDLLAIRSRYGDGDLARQEKIAGKAGADTHLVALAAETFDGLEQENLTMSHVQEWV